MKGTEKQIAWAQDILENARKFWNESKDESIAALEEMEAKKGNGKAQSMIDDIRTASALLNCDCSQTIIDNRDAFNGCAIFKQTVMGCNPKATAKAQARAASALIKSIS